MSNLNDPLEQDIASCMKPIQPTDTILDGRGAKAINLGVIRILKFHCFNSFYKVK